MLLTIQNHISRCLFPVGKHRMLGFVFVCFFNLDSDVNVQRTRHFCNVKFWGMFPVPLVESVPPGIKKVLKTKGMTVESICCFWHSWIIPTWHLKPVLQHVSRVVFLNQWCVLGDEDTDSNIYEVCGVETDQKPLWDVCVCVGCRKFLFFFKSCF